MGIVSLRDRVERLLERLWSQPLEPLAWLIVWPLGLASIATRLAGRRRRRRSRAAPALPTVAIGNLHAGGTGKTQVALELCARTLVEGRSPAVVLRGYGGSERGPAVVGPSGDAARFGDEALLLARRCPGALVVVSRDRAAGIALAAGRGADLALLDDGLQQRDVEPSRNLVLFPAESPLGNGHLLPLGPLREPLGAMPRERLVWLHGEGAGEPPFEVDVRSVSVPVGLVPSGDLGAAPAPFAGLRILAFCGIARPARFFRTLEIGGAELAGRVAFGDHRRFRPAELVALAARAREAGAGALCCTEKDAVRLPSIELAVPILALRVCLRLISGEPSVRRIVGAARWPA